MKVKTLFVVLLIIGGLLGSYIMYKYAFTTEDKEYLTFDEFLRDMEVVFEDRHLYFRSYSLGDTVNIRDRIRDIMILNGHEIELNKTHPYFSRVLADNVTYTLFFLKSIYPNDNTNPFYSTFHIALEGNLSAEYHIDDIIEFNIKIENYNNIPLYGEYWHGELCREFFPALLHELEGIIYVAAMTPTYYNLSLGNATGQVQQIYIVEKDRTDAPLNYFVKIYLQSVPNNSTIDILTFNGPNYLSTTLKKIVINSTYGHLQYIYNLETQNNTLVVYKKIDGIQTYRITLYWSATYPINGYDEERVVGEIEFQ